MDNNVVLRQFDQIQAKEQRLTIVKDLVDRLSFSERVKLQDYIHRRHDFLSALPIELIIRILNYLPLFEAWRLRLVCKRWNSTFRLEDVQNAVLAQWQTHDVSCDQAPESSMPERSLHARVRHIQAVRLGRPFFTVSFDETVALLDTASRSRRIGRIALCGATLAYVRRRAGDESELVVRDLVNGVMSISRGDAKEQIHCLALTNTHLSFISYSGNLYVASLANLQQRSRYRLPSIDVAAISAYGSRVAVALRQDVSHGVDPSTTNNPYHLIVLYDTSGTSSISIPDPHDSKQVESCRLRNVQSMILKQYTLDLFGHHEDDLVHCRLRQGAKSTFIVEAIQQYDVGGACAFEPRFSRRNCLNCPTPTGARGVYQLGFISKDRESDIPNFIGNILLFDTIENEVFVETCFINGDHRSKYTDEIVKWKDTLYGQQHLSELVTYRLRPSTTHPSECLVGKGSHKHFIAATLETEVTLETRTRTPYTHSPSERQCVILANESFLVHVNLKTPNGSITVRSFDERVRMPGSNITGCWDTRPKTSYMESHQAVRPLRLPFTAGLESVMQHNERPETRELEDIATDGSGRRASYMID